MPMRMLQLVGGLLAVGALAVASTAATADAPPTAKLSGDGSGCNDNWGPHSGWGSGNWNGDHGYWNGWGDGNGYFGGWSRDRDCRGSGSTATAARVARVQVAVQRLRGSRCQHLSASHELGSRTRDCDAKWMTASGTRKWSHSIANPLPDGRYRLMHRAVDAAGNRGEVQVRRLRIR
jgi:hypothetical protein